MDEVYKLAQEYNLRVVEDAAQAFGSKRDKKLVGTNGDIICFSFDGIRILLQVKEQYYVIKNL